MAVSRRNMLKAGTVLPIGFGVTGMAGGALATCTPTGIQIDPNVLVTINNAVAASCNFIPAITTVIGLVNALFPAVNGVTSVAEATIAQIAAALCKSAPTPASAKLGAPIKIEGTDVAVHGWVVGPDGHLVYV